MCIGSTFFTYFAHAMPIFSKKTKLLNCPFYEILQTRTKFAFWVLEGWIGSLPEWKKVTLIDKWVSACDENFLHSFAFYSKTINTKVWENTEKYMESYNCFQPSNNQIYYCFLKAIVGTKDAISSQKIHCQGKLGSVFSIQTTWCNSLTKAHRVCTNVVQRFYWPTLLSYWALIGGSSFFLGW